MHRTLPSTRGVPENATRRRIPKDTNLVHYLHGEGIFLTVRSAAARLLPKFVQNARQSRSVKQLVARYVVRPELMRQNWGD